MADDESLALWDNLRLSYTETQGLPILLQEISAIYNSPKITRRHILTFAGGEEAIFCTIKSLLCAEDHAIVLAPCYQSVKSIPETTCAVTLFDLKSSESWTLDLVALEKEIIPGKTKMLLINFPNNPTGVTISIEKQLALVELARKYDLWIFSDEIYTGVDRDAQVAPSLCTVYEKAVSLGGVSKSYGMAGLRIGWVCTQNLEGLEVIAANKHYLSICNSAPSEILSLIAIRQRHQIWARNKAIIDHNLTVFRDFLTRYPHLFAWTEPQGACCGFMKVLIDVDLEVVAEEMAQKYGVLILPGSNFPVTSTNRNDIDKHLRIGFGRKNFPDSLQKFEELIPLYFASKL